MATAGTDASGRGKLISWAVCGVLVVLALLGGLLAPGGLSHSEPPPAPPAAQPTDQKKITYTTPEPPSVTPPASALLRLAGATAVVLVLCVLTLWIGKRWMRPASVTPGNDEVKIIGGVSLGNRCMVYVLQAGKTRIVAGLDHTGIKTIVPLPESFEPDVPVEEAVAAGYQAPTEPSLAGA